MKMAKCIAYFLVVISISAIKSDPIKGHPSGLAIFSIFNNQLNNRDVNGINYLTTARHKRDVLPSQENETNSQDVPVPSLENATNPQDLLVLAQENGTNSEDPPLLTQEDELNPQDELPPLEDAMYSGDLQPFQGDETFQYGVIASPLFFFDSILNLLKKMIFAATDPIIAAGRDFVLGFFDVTIRGLVTFTTKSEPPFILSSIIAHTSNSFIKRAVEFLVYIRETIRYFFDMFISNSNKRQMRAINDLPSNNPALRNFLVNLVNVIIVNLNSVTGGVFYPQLSMLQGFATACIDSIFSYSHIRQVRSVGGPASNNAALKRFLISLLYTATDTFNALTGGIFYPQLAMLQGLLTNLVDQIFPTL